MRTVLLVIVIIGVAAFEVHRVRLDGQLLRADPDSIPANPRLFKFALGPGKSAYESHCATCHGSAGQGDPARGIPNLTDADWLYGAGEVSDIERLVDYGIRSDNPQAWNLATMPAYARPQPSRTQPTIPPLTPGGIRDVVEFLQYLQGHDADTAAVSRGAAIYSNTGGCYDCHGTDAKGDTAIGAPNLTDKITLYGDGSRQALFNSIALGHQGICPAWARKLSPADIRKIAVYVYTLSQHTATPTGGAVKG